MEVRGRCHPPPVKDPKYRGWALRESEVLRVMPKWVGKPVHIEHDESQVVGKVKSVFKDKASNCLVVDLTLDSTKAGWAAMEKIQRGELGELSLGFDAARDKNFARVGDPIPIEISLVQKGAMNDALIFAMKVDDVVAVSSEKSKSVYASEPVSIHNSRHNPRSRMNTTTNEDGLAQGSETDVTTRYSKEQLARLVKIAEETESQKVNELKDAIANFIAPAWKKLQLTNATDGIPDIGDKIEKILDTPEGFDVLRATAMLSGNFLKFEKMYLDTKEQLDKMTEEKSKLEASRAALIAEDERKTSDFSGIAPMFAVSVANSAGNDGAETTSNKRPRISELFTPNEMKSAMSSVKNGLASGQYLRPMNATRNTAAPMQ